MNLPEKIVAVHHALDEGHVPHAFGGALALAWCTRQARGTIDVDVNVFVEPRHGRRVLDSLPTAVTWSDDDLRRIERDGQARIWWDRTPLDLFFNTTDFHGAASSRARLEPFMGQLLPFLSCRDIAVFKAFFNRTKDWADLEEMHAAGTLEADEVMATLIRLLGAGDERVARLATLASEQ